MKSSAKLKAFSFLAIAALGAAAFTGCTFSSDTTNDTDGGKQDPRPNPTPDGGGGGGGDTTDAGDTPPLCEATAEQEWALGSEECQTCADTSCCDVQAACLAIPGEPDGKIGCPEYIDCVADCAEMEPGESQDECYETCNDEELVVLPGVVQAYNALFQCLEQSCEATCFGGSGD